MSTPRSLLVLAISALCGALGFAVSLHFMAGGR